MTDQTHFFMMKENLYFHELDSNKLLFFNIKKFCDSSVFRYCLKDYQSIKYHCQKLSEIFNGWNAFIIFSDSAKLNFSACEQKLPFRKKTAQDSKSGYSEQAHSVETDTEIPSLVTSRSTSLLNAQAQNLFHYMPTSIKWIVSDKRWTALSKTIDEESR